MKKIHQESKKCPLVTVITPTYNRAAFLEKTILSVLKQDYPNVEYIILDDGSTDNTSNIIMKFEKKIIWVFHRNMGEIRTVNKGFALARGEIITVVNSDDSLLVGAISSMMKVFVQNPKIIVAYPDWVKIDGKGREIEKIITPEYSYEYMLRNHDNITGPGTFFRKKILDTLKGRDAQFKYVSDYDFWLRAGLLGDFIKVPKILATSRVHVDQLTFKDRGYKMAMEHIYVINKIFSFPNLPSNIKKIKLKAYEKACEAARICRGDRLITKIIISLVCLYYSPLSYFRTFVMFRLIKLRKLLKLN